MGQKRGLFASSISITISVGTVTWFVVKSVASSVVGWIGLEMIKKIWAKRKGNNGKGIDSQLSQGDEGKAC